MSSLLAIVAEAILDSRERSVIWNMVDNRMGNVICLNSSVLSMCWGRTLGGRDEGWVIVVNIRYTMFFLLLLVISVGCLKSAQKDLKFRCVLMNYSGLSTRAYPLVEVESTDEDGMWKLTTFPWFLFFLIHSVVDSIDSGVVVCLSVQRRISYGCFLCIFSVFAQICF